MGSIKIRRLKKIDEKQLDEINFLITMLSAGSKCRGAGSIAKILSQKNFYLLAAFQGKNIVGIGSIYFQRDLCHYYGFINDMVTASARRGRGIGRKILDKLILIAKKQKAEFVNLTSKPEREAANKLYGSYGFQKRETNYYRLKIR